MTGKVAALTGPMKVEIQEYPLPTPEKGALLAEIIRSNLCGSELHIWRWAHPIIKNAVLGHEMIARIHTLGEGVETDYAATPVSVGDRIVAPYYITCLRCAACARGDLHLCQNAYRWWSQPPEKPPHFTGTFATHYYIQPNQYFYRVPESLPSDIVAGANCGLSQVLFGLEEAGLTSGETLLILGAGGLGLYATAVAKEKGARVIVVDAVASRLELAGEYGADELIDLSTLDREGVAAKVLSLTRNLGADLSLEVAGVPGAFVDALNMTRVAGRVLSIGNVSVGEKYEVPIAPGLITRKSLRVMGVVRYKPWYLKKALEFLGRNHEKLDFSKLTVDEFPLTRVQEALIAAESRKAIRPVIVPGLDG